MSEMPQFHYSMANGERKSFIAPGVYTSNRQFRLLLCNKLSDRSQTALRLSQHPTLSLFPRSCITHIGHNVGLVPHDDIPRMLRSKHSGNKKGESGGNSTGLSALTTSYPLATFYISYSKSKVNQKESSPQPMDRWEKLNFDGVYPLVNRAHVILLASGGHPRQSTRVMAQWSMGVSYSPRRSESNLPTPTMPAQRMFKQQAYRICPSFIPQALNRYA